MNERIEKIKTHFREHKEAYVTGTTCLAVGVVITVLFRQNGNNSSMTRVFSPGENNLIQVNIPKPGNSGNMIYCAMDDTYYPSQEKVAKALGENRGQISKLVNGKMIDNKGYGLEKVAENGIALAA